MENADFRKVFYERKRFAGKAFFRKEVFPKLSCNFKGMMYSMKISLEGEKMEEKIKTPVYDEVRDLIMTSPYFKVLLFGASNTERYMPCIHWSDVLETGLLFTCGRKFHMINSGVSGNNTREALARFERDVAAFSPDIVIITFAGNDCNPDPARNVPKEEFSRNLDTIVEKIRALGGIPILQTYYKNDGEGMDQEVSRSFREYLELIREAALRNKVFLVDQYKYFDRVPPELLRYKLLLNPMHVNEFGNTFIGVNLLHHFGIDPRKIRHHERLLPAIALYENIAE